MTYRGFSIEIIVGRDNRHFYRIGGNGLQFPINDGLGERTEARAMDEAKEFIDEHLVVSAKVMP